MTIADVSVAPRVAMYPIVGLPVAHPNVSGRLARLHDRPSFVRSLDVASS
jgi:glutathione S-transferase